MIERQRIRTWLEYLHRMDANNSEEMAFRNDYMWLLLLMLQNKKLCSPFDEMPPIKLKPLKNVVVSVIITIHSNLKLAATNKHT